MVVTYYFDGDDYNPGTEFEYEVDYDQRVEAIANYMADNYIQHLNKQCKFSDEQISKLRLSKSVLAKAFSYTLKDFDLVSDEVEDDLEEIIKEYWEEDAYEVYKNN
jgi:hypothetical protein